MVAVYCVLGRCTVWYDWCTVIYCVYGAPRRFTVCLGRCTVCIGPHLVYCVVAVYCVLRQCIVCYGGARCGRVIGRCTVW